MPSSVNIPSEEVLVGGEDSHRCDSMGRGKGERTEPVCGGVLNLKGEPGGE